MMRSAAAIAFGALLRAAPAAAAAAADERSCLAAEGEGQCAAGAATSAPHQEHLLLQVAAPLSRFEPKSDLVSAEELSAESFVGQFKWHTSGKTEGDGLWCRGFAPSSDFSLRRCNYLEKGYDVKVLTYNLFWWNLFGIGFRNGNGGSAGHLIADAGRSRPFDFMGFQECDDVGRVLRDAGLDSTYGTIVGAHSVAIAYRKSEWQVISSGIDEVAEDRPEQWWGTRAALWARFSNFKTKRSVFFMNHHGPLPVGTGGRCGGRATAWNLLKTIGTHAQDFDGIVLVGDFNSEAMSGTVQELEARLHRIYTGVSFGGVDHVFSNCGGNRVTERRNLGGGGSDHDALEVIVQL